MQDFNLGEAAILGVKQTDNGAVPRQLANQVVLLSGMGSTE